MARLIWTERAIADLADIAEYIAIDTPEAARRVVARVYAHVSQLSKHPLSGPLPPEINDQRYRQITEPPCRVIYRYDDENVRVIYVMRAERILRLSILGDRE